ncbi:MAG: MFS transporter [Hyphomicrobiales bacterium]|nr:MAG: MFS transporter [Hyphomicrobiales bacterium]
MSTLRSALSRREFIFLAAGLMMVDALAIDIMLPALPDIGDAFGVLRDNDRSLVITAFLFGFGLPQIVFGPLSDHFGRRPMILGGMVAYIACTLLAIVSPSFMLLLACRFLQGVAAACVRVALGACVRDLYSGKAMAEIMSLILSIFLLVPIIMPGVGQLILLVGPWQLIFLVMGGLAALFGTWAFLRLAETLAPAERRPLSLTGIAEGFAIVLTNRRAFFYGIASTFLMAAVLGFILPGQQIFAEQYGWGPYYPLAMTGMGGAAAICSLLSSRIIRVVGVRRSAHYGALLLPLLALTAALLNVTVGLSAYAYLAFVMAFALPLVTGFSSSGALSMEPLGAVAGTAQAVFGLISTLGAAYLSYLIAQSYDGTTTPILLGIALMGLLTFACFFIAEGGKLFGEDPAPLAPAAVEA